MGASKNRRYGPDSGAEVILPKQLLAAALLRKPRFATLLEPITTTTAAAQSA